ncbi:MAG: HdeD family acid-resistance protein, partial [Gaiellaceae bacterium]
MSGGDQGNHGTTPTPDPGYSGAKAGTMGTLAPSAIGAPKGGFFAPSEMMSTFLAANWWAVALRGVFGIFFGILALAMPGVTIAVLILWFAAYMLVDGVFAIVSGVRAGVAGGRWGALIVEGIVDLVAGAIAFLLPAATLLAFVWVCAAWAIVSGVLLLSAVFRL